MKFKSSKQVERQSSLHPKVSVACFLTNSLKERCRVFSLRLQASRLGLTIFMSSSPRVLRKSHSLSLEPSSLLASLCTQSALILPISNWHPHAARHLWSKNIVSRFVGLRQACAHFWLHLGFTWTLAIRLDQSSATGVTRRPKFMIILAAVLAQAWLMAWWRYSLSS
ncbi:hypothetical protein FGO68_gene17486 [Halteria grandinella]|uniref:Uncharacterized protein n=1 Tax=Halteria grandinella TaxID=5974 RepID=A0A8J8T0B0_HALGN|nr:hypothetical protein FGO68_gene17486 [Halteria grandinella]